MSRDAAFLLEDPAFARRLTDIDRCLPDTAIEDRPALLVSLPAQVFALLCLYRPAAYPNLARWLPRMPDAAVQANTTGSSGQQTMLEASAFVQRALGAYARWGGDVAAATVLDFGVGWARIARLLYQHVATHRLFATDAWPHLLQHTQECGFAGRLALIDEAPSALPFPDERFDLVLAFSVFTHLSKRTGAAAVAAIRAGMRQGGLFIATVRPGAFADLLADERREALRHGLAREGFGYFPEPWSAEGVYGDAVVSLEHVARFWTGFELLDVDVDAHDPYQLILVLRAREPEPEPCSPRD